MQQNCQNYWRKTRKMLFTPLITAELIGLLQYFKSLWAFFRIHNNIDHVGILLAMITRQSWISDFARAVGLPIICIPSAQKFSEYYLHLPGILNDPVCCMTLLTIEWSLLQRPLQQRLSVLLNGLDNLRKLPLSPWGTCTPSAHPNLIQNCISIGSVVFTELYYRGICCRRVSICHTLVLYQNG